MLFHRFADIKKPTAGRQSGHPQPSYMPLPFQGKPVTSNDVHIISSFDEELDFFNSGHTMADTDSSMPYIKNEPDDRANDPNQYMMNSHGYAMPSQQFGQFGNHQGDESIDPSELTMQNGSGNFYSFGGSQQNLSSSFNMGGAGIADDELLDLDINDHQGNQQNMQPDMSNYYSSQRQPSGISMSHTGQMANVYSNTPDGAPIQSPFNRPFDYSQFGPMGQQFNQQNSSHPGSAQFNQNSLHNAKTRQLQTGMERKTSDTRSPMTPRTPAMGALRIGSPESGSFQSQPIRAPINKQLSGAWNSPNSPYVDSPLSSPGNPSHHAASMSEILKSGKHASLPNNASTKSGTSQDESQEAKRKRRRASHNMVERRRRDNINERIQDLSHLVPQHRLEDDKVKKHLSNNSPMSPTLGATSLSPPHATSLLAGGTGRRATAGNITMGIPIEDKEKGPNKGDILNGSVSWTRDLMWSLHGKIQQESALREYIDSIGGQWPFEQTEDEKRMQTELLDAIEKNDPSSFSYSRTHGSGLRVPKHTNVSGDPVGQGGQMGTMSPQSLSPAFHSGGSGANSGGQRNEPQFWSGSGHAGISFKEEEEYDMDMA